MGCQGRKGAPSGWHRFAHGGLRAAFADSAIRCEPLQNAIARGSGARMMEIGPPAFGGLWKGDEQCGLCRGEAARLFSEPGEARRAHAFEIAAEGGAVQVELQDFILGEAPLERKRHPDLAQLPPERTRSAFFQQPRGLHGERGAARDDPPVCDRLPRGAQKRQKVHA